MSDATEPRDITSQGENEAHNARRARAVRALSLQLDDQAAAEAEVATIRGYLARLLWNFWQQGDQFNPLRPMHSSVGWYQDLYVPLIREGLVAGKILDNGGVAECDARAADQIIRDAINLLGEIPTAAEAGQPRHREGFDSVADELQRLRGDNAVSLAWLYRLEVENDRLANMLTLCQAVAGQELDEEHLRAFAETMERAATAAFSRYDGSGDPLPVDSRVVDAFTVLLHRVRDAAATRTAQPKRGGDQKL